MNRGNGFFSSKKGVGKGLQSFLLGVHCSHFWNPALFQQDHLFRLSKCACLNMIEI